MLIIILIDKMFTKINKFKNIIFVKNNNVILINLDQNIKNINTNIFIGKNKNIINSE